MASEQAWPSGVMTFLFTDIEDSTPLWDQHRSAMRQALAEHDGLMQLAVEASGGVFVKSTGDGIMAVFAAPTAALSAALEAQRALSAAQWATIAPDKIRVRMGLHTGEAELRAGDYFGTAVNRTARLMSAGHGGQVLLSGTTAKEIRSSLVDDVVLIDLGEHHLKGLSRPARIFQVETSDLEHDFPPLRTSEALMGNLPQPLTSFIGREQELAQIRQLLAEKRLLTLAGPGGSGKTRLALESGRRAAGFYDHGVWLVELAPLADGELVPSALARLFDLHEQPGMPMTATIADYLRGKNLLLILDNCEHLVGACAQLASDLLPAAPQLTILASSREGLGVLGETTIHIPPMAIPARGIVDRDEVARFEAVRLFVDRARVAKPGFGLTADNSQAVSDIARRLDGIPLAIELAAARIRLLSPAQIAARLDDRFHLLTGGSRTALPRQQTLRAMIDWSYDLLDEGERWFLRQMAVFSGGWTLEAAEYVVAAALESAANSETGFLPGEPDDHDPRTRFLDALDLADLDALDLTANLVNKSLARIDDSGDDMRYFYLETIRQYARDRLYEAGEGPYARDVHLQYFLRLADDGFDGSLLAFTDQKHLDRLENDLENLRTALDWGAENDPVLAVDLLRYLTAFWTMLGLGSEASRRGQRLLEALDGLPAVADEEMVRRLRARAFSLNVSAMGAGIMGGSEQAYVQAKEAAAIFRDDGSLPEPLADVLYWQAIIGLETGHSGGYEAAQECYQIALSLGAPRLQHVGLMAMARWELIQGNYDDAAGHVFAARELEGSLGNPILAAYGAVTETLVHRARGDFQAARRALGAGVYALRNVRHRLFANILDSELGHVLRSSGDLTGAAGVYRNTIVEWQDLGHRAAVANQLECFAFIAIAESQWERGARLFGAAEALRELLSSSMAPEEKNEYEASVANLRREMDPALMGEAWQAGRALDLDAAVDLALSERGEE